MIIGLSSISFVPNIWTAISVNKKHPKALTCGVCEKFCLRNWVLLTCGHKLSIWVAAIRTNFTPSSLLEMEQARLATWGEKKNKNKKHEMEAINLVYRGLGREVLGHFLSIEVPLSRTSNLQRLTVTVQHKFTLIPLPLGLLVHNTTIFNLGLIRRSFSFTSFPGYVQVFFTIQLVHSLYAFVFSLVTLFLATR